MGWLVAGLFTTTASARYVPPPLCEAVLTTGDPAPGIPGATIADVNWPAIDAEGNILLPARLAGDNIDDTNSRAFFYGTPGNVTMLLWERAQVPNMPDGVIVKSLRKTFFCMSETGWIVTNPSIMGTGITEGFNDRVVLVGLPGDLQKVMQAGDQAPECAPGELLDSVALGGLFSDNGTLAIGADLTETGYWPDHAVWIGSQDSLVLLYREGMDVPGMPGTVFDGASGMRHNDAGRVAFHAHIQDTGWGYCVGGPGSLTLLTCEGEQVPGLDEGVVWSHPLEAFVPPNVFGDISALSYVAGPGVTRDNDEVLFLGDRDTFHTMVDQYDNTAIGWGSEATAFFQDVTIGENRTLDFRYDGGPIYCYGTLARQQGATVRYWAEGAKYPMIVTHETTPSLLDLIRVATVTIYGDWNGDCVLSNTELADLQAAITGGPGSHNPLMDYDCDGVLSNATELPVFLNNMTNQPPCIQLGGMAALGDGGPESGGAVEAFGSYDDVPGLATWLTEVLSPEDLAAFKADLATAVIEFADTPAGDDLAELLLWLE